MLTLESIYFQVKLAKLKRIETTWLLFSIVTSMCCDDAYLVTPHVSALARCDRLVSEPLVIEKRRPEEELEEDPQENFEEEDEETDSELQSIARSESKPKELEDTCESSVRPKLDFPKTIPAYMLPDFPSRLS
ncbi:hypothetical protein Tco_0019481 [Tanacetum coccineum]